MKASRFIVALAASAALSLAVACGGAAATPDAAAPVATPAIDVQAIKVQTGTIEATLELSGNLAPRARVGVKPRVPGALERVLVDIGAQVREGQTVATIDRREIDAQAVLDPAVFEVELDGQIGGHWQSVVLGLSLSVAGSIVAAVASWQHHRFCSTLTPDELPRRYSVRVGSVLGFGIAATGVVLAIEMLL